MKSGSLFRPHKLPRPPKVCTGTIPPGAIPPPPPHNFQLIAILVEYFPLPHALANVTIQVSATDLEDPDLTIYDIDLDARPSDFRFLRNKTTDTFTWSGVPAQATYTVRAWQTGTLRGQQTVPV